MTIPADAAIQQTTAGVPTRITIVVAIVGFIRYWFVQERCLQILNIRVLKLPTRGTIAVNHLFVWSATAVADDDLTSRAKSILVQNCLGCHSGDHAKGNLDLTTREKIVAGGESGSVISAERLESSSLWQRVEQDEMPPKRPLSASDKQTLKAWILAGANWSGGPLDPLAVSSDHRAGLDWWSLQTLKNVSIPLVASANP